MTHEKGYEGDGRVECRDVNECKLMSPCGLRANCINTDGSFDCACPTGFIGDPWIECEDYDNCVDEVLCGYNEICVNEVGTYRCDCKDGWHQVGDNLRKTSYTAPRGLSHHEFIPIKNLFRACMNVSTMTSAVQHQPNVTILQIVIIMMAVIHVLVKMATKVTEIKSAK